MNIYTTCESCGEKFQVLGDRMHHWGCPEPPLTQEQELRRAFLAAAEAGAVEADSLAEQLEHLDDETPKMGPAALWYAQHYGWPVFPLRPATKIPAIPAAHGENDPLRGVCKGECGKLGHGLYDATTNPDMIKRWWTYSPYANIGLRTGLFFDVIDVDLPDGPRALNALDKAGRLPEVHGKVITRSCGLHLLVRPTGAGNKAKYAPGIDYRGDGGYIVAPPSRISKTEQWRWAVKPSPEIYGGKK